jgi:hypothetical protein
MGGERLPRAAAGYNALGTVSDKGSRTIFEALLGHLLRSYRAFVEEAAASDRIRANRGRSYGALKDCEQQPSSSSVALRACARNIAQSHTEV